MTKAEYIERYGIERYEQHKAQCNALKKERYRNVPEFRESQKAWFKEHYQNEPEFRESVITRVSAYNKNDLNSTGKPKYNIRCQSNQILFRDRKHSRLKGYEIHHAFGYGDPSKFIYIPKLLHNKIHQFLRDHEIDADSNHYKYIVDMINECNEYTYISV